MSDEDNWQPRTAQVTPQLLIGPPPTDAISTPVSNAHAAVEAIGRGQVAVLPPYHWDVAAQVLEMLGLNKAERVLAFMHAQNGQSLPVERLNEDELEAALRGVSTRAGNGGHLCDHCGYFEELDLQEISTNPRRYLPESCPVCHGKGFD